MKLLLTLIFSFVSIGYVHASELAVESGEDVFLEVGNIELILFNLISIDITMKWVVM